MQAAALAMDESILDVDQVENLIKFCPTKEEIELLKNYTGDKENLGKCEKVLYKSRCDNWLNEITERTLADKPEVRADRIQSDLEELLKALTERCKKHSVTIKSTALIELPHVTIKEEVVESKSDEQGNNQRPTTNSLVLREDETELNLKDFQDDNDGLVTASLFADFKDSSLENESNAILNKDNNPNVVVGTIFMISNSFSSWPLSLQHYQ
nr:epidermal growth factor receptor substrate 15-like 1 isoform X2 [Ipomoea trifida]